jgi:hypothetical protein
MCYRLHTLMTTVETDTWLYFDYKVTHTLDPLSVYKGRQGNIWAPFLYFASV